MIPGKSKRVTIYSCGTQIDTPGSPEKPVIRLYCVIASVPFGARTVSGRRGGLLLFRKQLGNDMAGVSLGPIIAPLGRPEAVCPQR